MSKKKIAGLVLTFFSLLMIIGSTITHYPIIAQITWSLVVIVGLVLFFWGGFPKAKVNFSIKAQKIPIQDSKSIFGKISNIVANRRPRLSFNHQQLTVFLVPIAIIGILFYLLGFNRNAFCSVPLLNVACNSFQTIGNHVALTQTPPFPECQGKQATDSNLSERCKHWFKRIQEAQNLTRPYTPANEISVKATGSHYKTVTSKPTGWFTSGQDADIMLSGIDFNNTGGPLLFNHPGPLASDGTHLILPDTFNNRVLIWNKALSGNNPPDLVLGQKNFTTNNPGRDLDEMNWPTAVSAAGGKLAIADANNSRILIWNSFPTKNGQAADMVINSLAHGPQVSKLRLFLWPWGVWTDGHRLLVSASAGGYILGWNNFPTQNDQAADYYVATGDHTSSPRGIVSDGKHLLVGDIEATIKGRSGRTGGAWVWNNFPTSDRAADYFIEDVAYTTPGAITQEGKLIISGTYLDIWNSFPVQNTMPDLKIGCLLGRCHVSSKPEFLVEGGNDGVVYINGKLYISLYNGNKIVVYNHIPTDRYQLPDFAIGSPDINTNTLMTSYIYENPITATDGKSLFVGSSLPSQVGLYVYTNIPNQSGAQPDYVYDFPGLRGFGPNNINVSNGFLIVAGRAPNPASQTQDMARIFIWSKLPLHGEMPDQTLTEKIGNIQLQWIGGAAMDDKYFYVSDYGDNKIYVFQGVPKDDRAKPVFVLPYTQPFRLSTDGNYLVVTDSRENLMGHGDVGIYDIKLLSQNSKPFILPRNLCDNQAILSAIVSFGHLFVTDTACNRVVGWKDINRALANAKPDLTLGCTEFGSVCSDWEHKKIGINSLFLPGSLSFDGSFLWVGEDKLSERLLRFSIH